MITAFKYRFNQGGDSRIRLFEYLHPFAVDSQACLHWIFVDERVWAGIQIFVNGHAYSQNSYQFVSTWQFISRWWCFIQRACIRLNQPSCASMMLQFSITKPVKKSSYWWTRLGMSFDTCNCICRRCSMLDAVLPSFGCRSASTSTPYSFSHIRAH